ncbi:hypothetical protein V2J09_018738 [Rumex salicifolius]
MEIVGKLGWHGWYLGEVEDCEVWPSVSSSSISSVNQNSHGIRANIMPIDDESTQGSQISKELKLHNSDHPNYVLATTLLNERNYGHWRRSVEVSLRAKNKIGMVTGTCKKPDDKSPDAEQWEVVNNMLILQEEDQRQSHVSFKQDQDALALAAQRGGPKDASKGTSRGPFDEQATFDWP